MKKNFLCTLLIVFFVSVIAEAARVSPVRFDLSIPKGSSKSLVLNLKGVKGVKKEDLMVYPTDLSMDRRGALTFDSLKIVSIISNDSAKKVVVPLRSDTLIVNSDSLFILPERNVAMGSLKHSAVRWIKFEKSLISVLEDQELPLNFKITVPANADPGEYYAVIMVEPTKFTISRDKKVKFEMKSRVAVVVVINVPGRVYEKKGEALNMEAYLVKDTMLFVSSFKNSGNIHLDVTAQISLRNDQGVSFGTFPAKALNSPNLEAFVFPGAIRDFVGVFKRPLPTGNYVAEIVYNYGYDFRKARQIKKFSILRKVPLDEAKANFLSLESDSIEISLPALSSRTKVFRIINTDYRPLDITVEANSDIATSLSQKISLAAGEVKNIQLLIKSSENFSNPQFGQIKFIPNRGHSKILVVKIKNPLAAKK